MYYTDSKIITLNSANATRNNGAYLSNVVFPFQGLVTDDDNMVRAFVSILDSQIPCSFYNINTNNNVILFYVGALYTCTITPGNYTANTLLTAINNYFVSVSLAAAVTFDKLTGQFTFQFPVVSTIYLTYGTQSTTMKDVIGLVQTQSGLFVTPSNPVNVLGVKRISVKSDALHVSSWSSSGFSSGSLLATVPVSVAAFQMITYENPNNLRQLLNTRTLNSIDVEMLDENNNFINFNGIDWSVTLELNIERRFEDVQPPKLFESLRLAHLEELKALEAIKPEVKKLSPDEEELALLEMQPPESLKRLEV